MGRARDCGGPRLVRRAPRQGQGARRAHAGEGAHTQAGASPPGKRVSALCIRASTTPTTWMDDTEAASSCAWSLGQEGVDASHHRAKSHWPQLSLAPCWPLGTQGPVSHTTSLISKAHRHRGRQTRCSHTEFLPPFTRDRRHPWVMAPFLPGLDPGSLYRAPALRERRASSRRPWTAKGNDPSHRTAPCRFKAFFPSFFCLIPKAKVLRLCVISNLQMRKWGWRGRLPQARGWKVQEELEPDLGLPASRAPHYRR